MSGKTEILIQTETVRVRIMTLSAGETTPCHHHSEVTDNIFGLKGDIAITLQRPNESVKLGPGERCVIPPGRNHSVINLNSDHEATYLLIQGVGQYDFITD